MLAAFVHVLAATPVHAGPPALGLADPPVEPISSSTPAGPCQWPTTVAFQGAGFCSGTLVHPEVVLTAGHCLEGGGPGEIRFGEDATAPAHVVPVEFCKRNPGYVFPQVTGEDYALCKLAEPVVGVPPTPMLMGCEAELLQAGREVVIVGFGLDDLLGNAGIKRFAFTTIASGPGVGGAIVVGDDDSAACDGDSGGPAYIQLDDGSWRAFGIVSGGPDCGKGADTYALMHPRAAWFEAETGIDITPCHDADGTWDPGPECFGFATDPLATTSSWGRWCAGALGGASASCGEPLADDTDPPAVAIASPADGEHHPGASAEITVSIDADDGGGWGIDRVWLRIDGEDLAYPSGELVEDSIPPYELSGLAFPAGTYVLEAIARDRAGLVAQSDPVSIHVGDDPPQGGTDESGGSDGDDASDEGASSTSAADDGDILEPATRGDAGCGCRERSGGLASWWIALALACGFHRRSLTARASRPKPR